MRTIKVGIGGVGGGDPIEDSFEVDDNATEEEIEQEAKEVAFDYISWWWEEVT